MISTTAERPEIATPDRNGMQYRRLAGRQAFANAP
jgi:hypothetical protein